MRGLAGRRRGDRRRATSRPASSRPAPTPSNSSSNRMFLRVEHTTEFALRRARSPRPTPSCACARSRAAASTARRSGSRPSRSACASASTATTSATTSHHFDVLESHDRLAVTAVSTVMTPDVVHRAAASRPRRSSCTTTSARPATRRSPRASASSPAGTPRRERGTARARELMDAVRGELVYDPGATDVQTRADEVLALGRGVCQDFAHVLLATCRSAGIPARYVSGYLYDPTLLGDNAASHAWIDVWDERSGWMRARPDARPRADRGLRARRRRARLRRRAADARRLQGRGERDARRCGSACRRCSEQDCGHGALRNQRSPRGSAGGGVRVHGRLLERPLLGSERQRGRGATTTGPVGLGSTFALVARFAGPRRPADLHDRRLRAARRASCSRRGAASSRATRSRSRRPRAAARSCATTRCSRSSGSAGWPSPLMQFVFNRVGAKAKAGSRRALNPPGGRVRPDGAGPHRTGLATSAGSAPC